MSCHRMWQREKRERRVGVTPLTRRCRARAGARTARPDGEYNHEFNAIAWATPDPEHPGSSYRIIISREIGSSMLRSWKRWSAHLIRRRLRTGSRLCRCGCILICDRMPQRTESGRRVRLARLTRRCRVRAGIPERPDQRRRMGRWLDARDYSTI